MNQKALEPIEQTEQKTTLALGIDAGSTTVKAVVLNDADTVLFSRYQRHFSKVKEAVLALLQEVCDAFPEDSFTVSIMQRFSPLRSAIPMQTLSSNWAVKMQKSSS